MFGLITAIVMLSSISAYHNPQINDMVEQKVAPYVTFEEDQTTGLTTIDVKSFDLQIDPVNYSTMNQ